MKKLFFAFLFLLLYGCATHEYEVIQNFQPVAGTPLVVINTGAIRDGVILFVGTDKFVPITEADSIMDSRRKDCRKWLKEYKKLDYNINNKR